MCKGFSKVTFVLLVYPGFPTHGPLSVIIP